MTSPATPLLNSVQPDLSDLTGTWDEAPLPDLLTLADGPDGQRESRHVHPNLHGAIFGGQLLGQALSAAAHGLPRDRAAHSLQLNFLAAGQIDRPMHYEVRPLLDGRNFSVRHVLGRQGDRLVCSANVGFHVGEHGPSFQAEMPAGIPDPEGLPTLHEVGERHPDRLDAAIALRLGSSRVLELRPVDGEHFLFAQDRGGRFRYWVRARAPMSDDPALHRAALAYISDFWFPITSLAPHLGNKFESGLYIASLNHSIWFQRPARVDDWLFVDAVTPTSCHARGITTGHVFDRGGRLVATMNQEGLYRGWPSTLT